MPCAYEFPSSTIRKEYEEPMKYVTPGNAGVQTSSR